jgi:hypothetical protein
MSGLADILRGGVATAKRILGDGGLLASVYVRRTASPPTRNEDGTPKRPTRVRYDALVGKSNRLVRTAGGTEFVATSKITFLEPVILGAEDAVELPDGTIPTLQALGEGVQPALGGNLTTSVYCG